MPLTNAEPCPPGRHGASTENRRARELTSDGPNLGPTPEVTLLEVPRRRPSSGAVSRADDRAPIGAAVHCRSNAYRLVWWARKQDIESIANLKDSTGGMARIEETHE